MASSFPDPFLTGSLLFGSLVGPFKETVFDVSFFLLSHNLWVWGFKAFFPLRMCVGSPVFPYIPPPPFLIFSFLLTFFLLNVALSQRSYTAQFSCSLTSDGDLCLHPTDIVCRFEVPFLFPQVSRSPFDFLSLSFLQLGF